MVAQALRLRGIPLTPIHIGDGGELTPDTYTIEGGQLLLFDPARVLADLDHGQRERYVRSLNNGDLDGARRFLNEHVRGAHVTGRISLSKASAEELAPSASRSGKVHLFIRSGGRPFIPGSSIKGALRTALVDYFTQRDTNVSMSVGAVQDVGKKHRALTRAALGLRRDDTADDPLRFLSVADVTIPDGSTRVDRTIILKRGRDGTLDIRTMQMHYERLLAASDGPMPQNRWLTLSLALDMEAMQRASRSNVPPGRTFDLRTLHDATCAFSWGRWLTERKRFFAGEGNTVKFMDRLLRSVRVGSEGRTLADVGPEAAPNYWLIRIGRFSHFESKSVDHLRQGYRPQDKAHPQLAPGDEGLSRTVVRTGEDSKEALIPFGWLLLFHEAAR